MLALLLALAGQTSACAAPPPKLSEAASWLQAYLRIDTTNPPGNESKAADFLAGLLQREGIPVERLTSPSGRVSLVARLAGSAPSQGALILTHHMDVVPAGPGWTVDPFAAEVKEGELWGRGAVDTKGLGIAHLAALVDLKRRKVLPERDVVFLAVADEEKGGAEGTGWLLQAHPELFARTWAVFNEGGVGRVGGNGLLWWEVEVAQKRPLWLKLTTRGRGGHGSNYLPDSATHRLIQALARILELPHTYRVSPPVERYFAALAPLHANPRLHQAFSHIRESIGPQGPKVPLLPGLDRLFLDTIQVTVIEASQSINVIPQQASALLDIRLLPDTDAERFLGEIRRVVGKDADLEVVVSSPPSPPSPTDHPAYQAVVETFRRSAPVVPSVLAGFTDSRYFRERNIPAYGVSPFEVDPLAATGVHGPNERISLKAFDAGVERMKRLVEQCAHR